MKKTGIYLLLFLFIMSFGGCDKTDDGSYVRPITISEKIAGTWTLSKLTQIDEIAKANSEAVSEIVLTDQHSFKSFSITFNVDADQNPTSYSVTGEAPELLATNGYWDMDYPYPHTDLNVSKIVLYSDAAKTAKTLALDVMSLPGSKPELQFLVIRKHKGVPFVSYSYQLSVQSLTK